MVTRLFYYALLGRCCGWFCGAADDDEDGLWFVVNTIYVLE